MALTVPRVEDPEYVETISDIIKDHHIELLISLNDLELPVLSKSRNKLEKEGCRILVSNEQVIDTCFDKLKTIKFANELDIRTPATYTSLNTAKKELRNGNIDFPLVVKPRWGSSSIGLEFPEDEKELEWSFNLLNHRLDRTILRDVSSIDRKNAIIIQKKIHGSEYGLDIINDLNGRHRSVIVKRKLAMRAGETDKAMAVVHQPLQELGRLIGERLGHIANLDCDFFEDDEGKLYLLEMNPRFGGGYPFSHEAGANLPKAILQWIRDEKVPDSCFEVEKNRAFAKCDYLVKVSYS